MTENTIPTGQEDPVNPPHYKKGSIECIQAIKACLTEDEFRGYVKGAVMKYIWRERHKGADMDLKKAIWYLYALTEGKVDVDGDPADQ